MLKGLATSSAKLQRSSLHAMECVQPSRCRWSFVRHGGHKLRFASTPLNATAPRAVRAPGDCAASCRALSPIELRCRHGG